MTSTGSDDVQLTDLEVIQQFSLAVRGATAPRAQVIAALESDLAYLQGSRRKASTTTTTTVPLTAPAKTPAKTPAKAPAKAAKKVAKAPAKKAARRA